MAWWQQNGCPWNQGWSSEDLLRAGWQHAQCQNQLHIQELHMQLKHRDDQLVQCNVWLSEQSCFIHHLHMQSRELIQRNDALTLKLLERECSLHEQELPHLRISVGSTCHSDGRPAPEDLEADASDEEASDEEIMAAEGAPPAALPQLPIGPDRAVERLPCGPDAPPGMLGAALSPGRRLDAKDADGPTCIDEGRLSETAGWQSSAQDAACQTDGEDYTVGPHPGPKALEGIQVHVGECTPHDLHLPKMLPYLNVQELLTWRLVSRRTRSPEALIQHVEELGSMDRPETIVAFAEQLDLVGSNPGAPFAAVFEGDAEQQKIFECRRWCTVLAKTRRTHFAESHVERIVGQNLRSLLQHCRSSDVSIADHSMILVMNHAVDGLPFVQGPIAEATLGMMEELVESSISANRCGISSCCQILGMVLRTLNKPQRQKWASLLTKLMMDEHVDKDTVIWRLRMLWLADDDPLRTYSEAQHQMKIFERTNSDGCIDIKLLLHSSCS